MHQRDYSQIQRRRYIQRNPGQGSLENMDVMLHIDSFCLGDTICWGSLLEAFVENHKPSKLCVTTFWPELFRDTDRISFLSAVSDETHVCDRFISSGYDKRNLNHVRHGMFWAAKESMKLPQDARVDLSIFRKHQFQRQQNKITIAPESKKKIARWDYLGNYGWQEVVDRLNSNGFEVHNVSHEQMLMLRGVHSHHGNDDINEALRHICESRIFIGLGSGLSWLAWAYGIPVVMIAGFTKPFMEFPCYRVINPHACFGCFNVFTNVTSSCPIFQGTPRANECHNSITPDMVMAQVRNALRDSFE
jgi:autotransporter strand-loop-strand O-heptosyltransferase